MRSKPGPDSSAARDAKRLVSPDRYVSLFVEMGRTRKRGWAGPDLLYAWAGLACDPAEWNSVLQQLSDGDLAELIRGLVLYDLAAGISSRQWPPAAVEWFRAVGAKSDGVWPVEQLFEALLARDPDAGAALADWVVLHCRNRTAPFDRWVPSWVSDSPTYQALSDSEAKAREMRRLCNARITSELSARAAARATRRLYDAVRRRDARAVAALLRRGADPCAPTPDGVPMVDFARATGCAEIVELLASEWTEYLR